MCDGLQCRDCEEKYECDYYQAYLGFGKYNESIVADRPKKPSKFINLDYYDNLNY